MKEGGQTNHTDRIVLRYIRSYLIITRTKNSVDIIIGGEIALRISIYDVLELRLYGMLNDRTMDRLLAIELESHDSLRNVKTINTSGPSGLLYMASLDNNTSARLVMKELPWLDDPEVDTIAMIVPKVQGMHSVTAV